VITVETLVTTENLSEEQDFVEVSVVALSSTCVQRKYGNLCFPEELLAKKAKSLIGKPVLLDHKWEVGSVVGVVKDAYFQNGRIIAKLQIVKQGNEKLINLLKMEPRPISDVSVGMTLETEKEGEDKNAKVLFEAENKDSKDYSHWWEDQELRQKAPKDYFLDPTNRKYPYRSWEGQISCARLRAAMSLAGLHGDSRIEARARNLYEKHCKGGHKDE
jgi:hypothetical protein